MRPLIRGLALLTASLASAGAQMPANPADQAMMGGMKSMQDAMAAAPMTGDPDHDFTAMMIPHHQGAVAMAQAELTYGKDPTLRKLAAAIIATQHSEIAQMQAWQARHGGN